MRRGLPIIAALVAAAWSVPGATQVASASAKASEITGKMVAAGAAFGTLALVIIGFAVVLRLLRWVWLAVRLPTPPRAMAERLAEAVSVACMLGFFVLPPAGLASVVAGTLLPLLVVAAIWATLMAIAVAFDTF